MDARPIADTLATLRDLVVERVRSAIVSGRSPPGTLFSVPTLAEEFGVSTTPVREALLELARAGLVTAVRNRGFRVEPMSLETLINLFAIRELIECFAVKALAERRPADRDELQRLARAIEEAVEREDVATYIEADRAFHAELVAQAGNPLLTRMVMEARDSMRLYGIETSSGRKRQVTSVAEHYRLIDLAAAGKGEAAAALLSRHILEWKPIFTAALAERDAQAVVRSPLRVSLR